MLKDKRVLVVDDSETARAYLRNIFASLEARVESAPTGLEGVDMCNENQYDLIVLDLLLPDTDGIEVLKQVRGKNDTSTIVMLTGYGDIRSAIAAMQEGADGYVQKQEMSVSASDRTQFLHALEQALNRRAGIIAKKQLEQVRADFYSMVTHDLRNPTTVILTAVEMALKGYGGPLTPQQHEFISIAYDAAHKLTVLIDNYLDFAQIDAGYLRLDFKEVELCEIVKSSAHLAQLQAGIKQQTLTLDLPPEPIMGWIDAERFKQVLDNLLSNAVKYTPEGGRITVRLRVEGDGAAFSVSDTGWGIPPEQLSVLFTKYRRVVSEDTQGVRGTGLGLVIVKEIVQAHSGTVDVYSEGQPEKGTTFVVTIPLRQEVETIPSEAPLPGPELVSAKGVSLDFSKDPELRKIFLEESQRHILTLQDTLQQLYRTPHDQQLIESAHLASHTLKGDAGAMQMTAIYELAAQIDDVLKPAARGSLTLTKTLVRDATHLLDRIIQVIAGE